MLIFLDSNILFDNWQLKNVNFIMLFNFISNEGHRLLISDLVVLETENNRKKKLAEAGSMLSKPLKMINQINAIPVAFDLSLISQPYDFKELLESKLSARSITYFDFEAIPQHRVVERALKNKRPFKEGEKGYRDTLIWLSLLHYLSLNIIEEDIIFINNNSDDFFNAKKDGLHDDLLQDIADLKLKCSFFTYKTLADFVKEDIDKNEHALVHSDLYNVEDRIQELSEDYFNSLSPEELRAFLTGYSKTISSFFTITNYYFEIDEGMEDPHLISSNHIKGHLVYVNYRYWLRMCTLSMTLLAEEYAAHRLTIPHNVTSQDTDYITIEVYLRLNMTVSFQYDTEQQEVDGFSVDKMDVRI